jgi:acetylornithine deacetylase/succinyl-diaminopimelate desuccinylase-like protein
VPGQEPAAIISAIRAHLSAAAPAGVRVEVTAEKGGAAAYTIDPDHPAVLAAKRALEIVYPGEKVINARIGGTLPGTVLFEEVLGAKTLFFSFSIADEMLHAPNEFIRVRRLDEGMRAWSHLWRSLAASGLSGVKAAGTGSPGTGSPGTGAAGTGAAG